MAFIITTLILIVCILIARWYLKLLKMAKIVDLIPGPPKLPLIGNIHQFQKTGSEFLKEFCKKVEYYRECKMFRFWLGPVANVVLYSAESIEPILTSSVELTKSFGYEFVWDWLGTGILTSTGQKWHARRKILTPAFHFQILNDFIHIYWEQSQVLINILKRKEKKVINISPLMTLCTLDIICETAMGVKINAQLESESDYVYALHIVGDILVKRVIKPWVWPNFIFYKTPEGIKYKKNLKILHDFTKKVILERSEEMKKMNQNLPASETRKLAFLDLLLQMSDDGKVLSFEDIQEEVDTIMFEGHDTTSTAAAWALFCIGKHPDVQKKLQEEMNCIFGDSDRAPSINDIREMKYLECVLKETLRLFPSAPQIGRKLTNDLNVCGKTIPKGTNVLMDIYNLHRDPSVFPNPNQFDPDRFISENSSSRNPFAYIPFSAGSRNCIGQKFAMQEEKVILSSLIRKFHIEAIQTFDDLKPALLLVLSPEEGIHVKFTSR